MIAQVCLIIYIEFTLQGQPQEIAPAKNQLIGTFEKGKYVLLVIFLL